MWRTIVSLPFSDLPLRSFSTLPQNSLPYVTAIVKKNAMDCLFSLSYINLSSSFILHLFIFICLFVCSLVSISEAPWCCPAFQYQTSGLDTAVSHIIETPTHSLHHCPAHCFYLEWLGGSSDTSDRRTSRCKLDESLSLETWLMWVHILVNFSSQSLPYQAKLW